MGSVVKKIPVVGNMVSGILNGPEDIQAAQLDKKAFDISKEAKPAQDTLTSQLTAQTGLAAQTNPQTAAIMNQMASAAEGNGPSLAETQMKAAQERNLSQQLAAVESSRGGSSAANTRALVNSMSTSGRGIVQDAATARLQERQNFLNEANQQATQVNATAGQQLAAAIAPKTAMQNYSTQQAGLTQGANIANTQAQNQYTGALIGAAGSIGAKMFTPAAAAAAEGGQIRGPGTETSDSIPARLSDGEFVVRAAVVKKPGMLEHLNAINEGEVDVKPVKKGRGGMIDAYMAGQGYMDGGPVTTYAADGGFMADIASSYHKAAKEGYLGTAPRIEENGEEAKQRYKQSNMPDDTSGRDVRTDEQKKRAAEISAQNGYARGGRVEEPSSSAMEVKPDKGYGKIIIIDKEHEDEEPGYADGGMVDSPTGGLGDLLKVNYADAGGQHMARHGHGSNLHTPAMHKGLAKALMAKAELHSTMAAELAKSKQKRRG